QHGRCAPGTKSNAQPGFAPTGRWPSGGPSPTSAGVGGREFELNVIGVPEDQDMDPKRRSEGPDLGGRHTPPVEGPHGVLEVSATRHAEAQMIEADAILIEAVARTGPLRIGVGTDAESHLTVAEEGTGVEVHELLETQHLGIEGDRALDAAHREPEVMDALGENVLRHEVASPHSIGPGGDTESLCPHWLSSASREC